MFEELLSRHGLSLDRLHAFLRVAEAGNITKAADGDLNRQSQFSRQIRELEEFFGAELTHRRGKSIVISADGIRLANLIRQQFQGMDDFLREKSGQHRSYTLGTSPSLMEWLVCPQMPALMKLLPQSTLRLESWRSDDLVERVRDGRLDFALVREDALPEGLPRRKLGKVRYVLAVPVALARAAKLTERPKPDDLARLHLAIQESGGNFHQIVHQGFADSGATLRPAVECQSFLQVRAIVESGSCAGIMPEFFTARLDPKKVLFLPLPFLQPYVRTLVLHWSARQMQRRAIPESVLQDMAAILTKTTKGA